MATDFRGFAEKMTTSRVTGQANRGVKNGHLFGINVEEIPRMKTDVENMILEISGVIDKLNTTADRSKAFKGEYESAVAVFIEDVGTTLKGRINYLREFERKLDEIQREYLAQDQRAKGMMGSSHIEVDKSA